MEVRRYKKNKNWQRIQTIFKGKGQIWVRYPYLYLFSAQYLLVLQDSKYYITHPTVQSNSDNPLSERQRLKNDHLSTSVRFFNLPLGIGPSDRGP